MTKYQEAQKIRKADKMLSEAHSLLIDVYEAREKKGEVIAGDALTSIIVDVGAAIDRFRKCGESPDYLAGWEKS